MPVAPGGGFALPGLQKSDAVVPGGGFA